MSLIKYSSILLLFLFFMFSCKTKTDNKEKKISSATPVTVTRISNEDMKEVITLNATSSFMKKGSIKSNTNGFIDSVAVTSGQSVRAGQILFTIRTKEANALKSLKNFKDTLWFKGLFQIRSSKNGIISKIDHLKGEYVPEGEELALLSDPNSFVFLLDVPYELHNYVVINSSYNIMLPDKKTTSGIISSRMPSMDINSQTESYIIRTNDLLNLPENLIAKVNLVRKVSKFAVTLPKSAVLSNETLSEFWVMKLINDSTAVKIPVVKGIESSEKVEILKPELKADDKIILKGNYGLPDTARVKINK